jgi:hypothetical protein
MAPVQTSSYGRFIIKGVPRKKGDWVDITATKEGYKPNHEKYLIGPAIEIRLERGR